MCWKNKPCANLLPKMFVLKYENLCKSSTNNSLSGECFSQHQCPSPRLIIQSLLALSLVPITLGSHQAFPSPDYLPSAFSYHESPLPCFKKVFTIIVPSTFTRILKLSPQCFNTLQLCITLSITIMGLY